MESDGALRVGRSLLVFVIATTSALAKMGQCFELRSPSCMSQPLMGTL